MRVIKLNILGDDIDMVHLDLDDFLIRARLSMDACSLAIRVYKSVQAPKVDVKISSENEPQFLETLSIVLGTQTAYLGYLEILSAGSIDSNSEVLEDMANLEAVRHVSILSGNMELEEANNEESINHLMRTCPKEDRDRYSALVALTLSLMDFGKYRNLAKTT